MTPRNLVGETLECTRLSSRILDVYIAPFFCEKGKVRFSFNHLDTSFNSQFILDTKSSIFRLRKKRLVSSANNRENKAFDMVERSLTEIRNNKGPKIDSWGTQHTKVDSEDLAPTKEVNCFLPDKLLVNQFRTMPLNMPLS
jgi:hypothetical protein